MRFYHRVINAIYSIFAKRTIGVRILLLQDEKVLLIKHTYQNGWYTIGGGVEPKETPRIAIERELLEEVGVTLDSPPELFAVYYSDNQKRDDYIVFYIGKNCSQQPVKSPEVEEYQWFSLNQLPSDITPATRRRIDEYLGHKTVSERW